MMIKGTVFFFILLLSTALFADTAYHKGIKAFQSKQYTPALKYFYISARHYNVNAYDMLGIIHEQGLGTGVNKPTASYWYEKAAQRNHPDAQYRLAHLYETGEGVKKNMKKATFWYQKAARNGNKKAKIRLANKNPKTQEPKDTNKSKGFFSKLSFLK